MRSVMNNSPWFATQYREELGRHFLKELDADIISVVSFMAYTRSGRVAQGATGSAIVRALNELPFLTTPEE